MYGKKFIGIVLLLVFLCSFNVADAKKFNKDNFKWEEITDYDWNIQEDSAKKIVDAAMIFEKITAEDEQIHKSKCYLTMYHRIRILNENGRQYGDVEVPFQSLTQKVADIQGRTILKDGTIIELQEANIFDKEVLKGKKFKFTQYTFSMPGVTDDCIIEYVIKYVTEFHVNQWIIQKDIALLKGEYLWKFYTGKSGAYFAQAMVAYGMGTPNYLWLNCGPDKSVKHLPNLKESTEMLFEISDVPPFEEEPYMVPRASLTAKLVCYYGSSGAPSAYWGDEAKSVNDYAKEFCEDNKKIKPIIESFGDLETDDEKIDSAYHWICDNITNLAYDDVYDNKGKKVEAKDNKCINDIIKHGYGDRTDISRLFLDMLREMNIDAKLAYAVDRSEDLLVYEAKYWQFDASLIAIPADQNYYQFFMPGYKYLQPGMVPWSYEGTNAFLAGANTIFSSVPFTSASFNKFNGLYNFEISDEFEISGSLDIRLNGQNGRMIRIDLEDNDSTEYEVLLKETYDALYKNSELADFTIENVEDISKPLAIKCTAEYPEMSLTGNLLMFKPFDYFTDADNPFFAQERKKAILFKFATEERENAQFTLPEGWKIEALPNDTVYANEAGECGINFINFGDKLTVQSYFTLNSPFWPVEYYPVIKELFQVREEFADQIIVLKEDL